MDFLKNTKYWFSSGYLFLFFITWSIWWSFYSIWLNNSLGLTGAQVGTIYSFNSFFSLFFMIIYGYLQDKLGTKKNLVWFQSLILVLIAPFVIYVYEPLLLSNFYLGAILGAIYLGAGFVAGAGFLESYTEKISRKYNFEFGKARMWGSLGYAVAAIGAGALMSINPHINFWIASFTGVMFLLLNMFFKVEVSKTEEKSVSNVSMKDIRYLFSSKIFWYLIIYLFGTVCIYTVYDQQLFPVYFVSLFTDQAQGNTVYGILNSVQVFVEALFLFLAPFIVNKIGIKQSLVFAGSIMAFRIVGSAVVTGGFGISFMKMLHAVELPILLIAVFKYISVNFDARLSATVYLIGFKVSSEIGVIIFSALVGWIYDLTNYQTTFYILGGIVVLFVMLSIFTLKNNKVKKVQKEEVVVPS
ncbi:oligosaccharide MFS transporter [Gracilibacillus sp. S3-1-1]|uniref:Oligosaccharide MFS transporter n=1 Tax=Gracilibacillus pellucidus TaxID=3095368 RepID=A0ACC6M2W8_9BACI|nr:oligosaccharide MFS transporter [Gracilibacillus sp. S3-1-1]MDX8045295.1 oligosaccharide MFS transporter [Gracilibacillus sp. S3-1-1]